MRLKFIKARKNFAAKRRNGVKYTNADTIFVQADDRGRRDPFV